MSVKNDNSSIVVMCDVIKGYATCSYMQPYGITLINAPLKRGELFYCNHALTCVMFPTTPFFALFALLLIDLELS